MDRHRRGLNSPALTIQLQRFTWRSHSSDTLFRSIGAYLAPDDPPYLHQKVNLPSHSPYAQVQPDSATSCVERTAWPYILRKSVEPDGPVSR